MHKSLKMGGNSPDMTIAVYWDVKQHQNKQTYNGKMVSPIFMGSFSLIIAMLAGKEDLYKSLNEFEFGSNLTYEHISWATNGHN